MTGSPEAPDPFAVERVFPKLAFSKPVEIIFTPDGKRAVVAQHEGRIVSFANDNASAKADPLLDVTQLSANEEDFRLPRRGSVRG